MGQVLVLIAYIVIISWLIISRLQLKKTKLTEKQFKRKMERLDKKVKKTMKRKWGMTENNDNYGKEWEEMEKAFNEWSWTSYIPSLQTLLMQDSRARWEEKVKTMKRKWGK